MAGVSTPTGAHAGRRSLFVMAAFALLAAVALWVPVAGAAAEGLDPQRLRAGLAIFCCIAVLWMTEALPLAATALLVPLLATVFRVSDVKTSLASFADPLIFLFLGGFALAAAMSRQGLDRWIAGSVVRLGKGRFLRVAFLLFATTAFLSMWMSNTATTAMVLPLALGILGQLRGDGGFVNERRFLLLGLAYSASIGGLGLLVGSPPNGIAAAKLGITFTGWARFGVPAVLVLLPAMIAVLYLLCRPGKGGVVAAETEKMTFDRPRVTTMAIFAVTALLWVFGARIGPAVGIGSSFDTAVALLAIFLLTTFRVVGWRDIDRGTDWGVLLLFGGGIALSGVLKDTGASLFLGRLLAGAAAGWPVIAVIAAVVAFVIFLTELSSNTAVAALFVPVFYSVAGQLEMMPGKLVLPLALAASCAFMLPVATPPNAIVFATGQVPQTTMMRVGLVLNLLFVLLLTALSLALF